MYESVSKAGWTYCYVPEELLGDKELLMAGLKCTGQILYFATPEMRDDKEVVLEAVKNKGIILKYASARLKSDLDVGIAAMTQTKKCYEFLNDDLKKNEQILELLNK